MTKRTGATKIKANSMGSVTPVRKEVNAAESRMPAATLGNFAWRIIARHAAGKPNIMMGKKPAIKFPAVGSPAK